MNDSGKTQFFDSPEEQIAELNRIAKTLVRRDLELSQVRAKQEEQIAELEQTARILVRRDAELTTAKERLERLNAEKSEFLSIVAHQLRTPLTGIKWSLAAVQRSLGEKVAEKEKELILQSLASTERMIALVNDFLNVVRIEEGRITYVFQPHNIRKFVKETAEMFAKSIEEKNIDFGLSVDDKAPEEIVFDDEKITIVLQNLLENAIKFTPPKEKISLSVRCREGKILFAISDNGIGIPEDERDKIFRKFSMASNAIMYEGGKGIGLGLYLSKNIVEAHGGEINFTSEEGKGSVFYFSIPLKTGA